MKKFEVYEDNGGNLYLVVYDNSGNVEYLNSEYAFTPGALSDDIDALCKGDDPSDWDGNEAETAVDFLSFVEKHPNEIVCVVDNKHTCYEKMGSSALLEFANL